MIAGTGIDVVSVDRIQQIVERQGDRFLRRVYTVREREAATGALRYQRLATRFAAKEAVLKALGTGLRGGRLSEVEVVTGEQERPSVVLHGLAAQTAAEMDIDQIHLSLSHTRSYGWAMAVAEERG